MPSVAVQTPYNEYSANGVTTVFAYTFELLRSSDLVVTVNGSTVANYSVSGVGNQAGGNITFSTAPAAGTMNVLLQRVIPLGRSIDYQVNGPFNAETVNLDFNLMWQALQGIAARNGGEIRIAFPEQADSLPVKASRIDRLLAFHSTTGQPEMSPFTVTQAASAIAAAYVGAAGPLDALSFIQSGVGAVSMTAQEALREMVTAKQFDADADGVADDTASINAALLAHRHVKLTSGTYNATTINMSVAGTVLEIMGGAVLNLTNAAITGVNVTAAGCSIIGPGKINSPASWDGSNARRTFATIWVAGEDFVMHGVTLNNIPRAGVHFEDVTNGRLENNRFIGNYPYASYNPATTLGQCAVDYNPPTTGGTTTATGNGSLIVVGNRVETCIQGVFVGNFDSAASEVGVTIVGNNFNRCWDHGVYMTLGKGHTITGNNFLNCKNPIVTDGSGATVVGNSLYATELTQSNGEQAISVRDAQDSVIADNTIYGLGASIYLDAITGTTIARNVVRGNVLRRTGAILATSAIRLGFNAQVCEDNVIESNTISGGYFGQSVGVMQLEMAATYYGNRNTVRNNIIQCDKSPATYTLVPGILLDSHNYLTVEGNTFSSTSNGEVGGVLAFILMDKCSHYNVSRNRFLFTSGGTNVTVRAIQSTNDVGGNVEENKFFLTSASLTAAYALDYIGGNANVQRNQIDGRVKMYGVFTWPAGDASYVISNANADATYSRVTITPTDNGGGTVIATKGIKAVITAGTITVSTADATTIAGNSAFAYELS